MPLSSALKVFLASTPGRLGLALLALLVGVSLYVLARYPLDFGTRVWNNPAAWADYPKAAPPAWTTLLGSGATPHTVLRAARPSQAVPLDGGEVRLYRLGLDYPHRQPPTFVAFTVGGVSYQARPPLLTLSLVRPDGSEVLLYRHVAPGPRAGEQPPYTRYSGTPLRVLLSADPAVHSAVADFLRQQYGADVSARDLRERLDRALFGVPDPSQPGAFQPLPGRYEVRVRVDASDTRDEVEEVRVVLGGSVFGLMGTDALGRDIAQGLLFGFPVALFIGLLASTLTTTIGAALGVMSGYLGGKADMAIQRLSDVLANVPVLPLLIFMVFVLGSHLLLIILVLVAFSWPGLTIMVRSMVLQLRTGQLVESARSIGASRWRIMVRHVFPHTAPFVFAQLIFFTPAAILAEAGLSFLGLGDPSLPTWGQILEAGFRTGAVYVGYWWWVIPPGLLIVLTAVTFMLLALAMEPVVNPRLRRM